MALSYSLILHSYDLCQPINSLSLPSLFTSKWGRWAGREPQAKRSHKVEAVSSGNASDAVLGCHAGRSGLVHFSLASLYFSKSPAEQSTACFPFQKSVFSSKRKTFSRILVTTPDYQLNYWSHILTSRRKFIYYKLSILSLLVDFHVLNTEQRQIYTLMSNFPRAPHKEHKFPQTRNTSPLPWGK